MKAQRLIKLLFVSLLLVACKKEYKEDTTVHFHLYNPVTNEAYSNVTVKIIEQKDVSSKLQLSSEYETQVIWEGKTDANGKASYSFKGYKSDKYTYWHSVDESFMAGKKIIARPDYGSLKMLSNTTLSYKVVLDNINVVIWRKNANCFDENDKCRMRTRSLIKPWEYQWSEWGPQNSPIYPNNYYEGCSEYLSSAVGQLPQNITEVEYEVTRNGITTSFRDTLYITGQNGTDTLKYFY